MAENLRGSDPTSGDLESARAALVEECSQQARNTLYTSTSFFIWLRVLKRIRGFLWILAALCSIAAASSILLELLAEYRVIIAGITLLGVILPGILKAVKLDDTITAYEKSAARLKNVEGELRRSANVWSHKSFHEFETEARAALSELDEARMPSLTPPEWCFQKAQKKVQSGDYDPD